MSDTRAWPPSISLVIPAFDEAENLPTTVPAALEVLRGLPSRVEVLVVDDGSRDATPSVVAALSAANPEVSGLRFRRNVGKAAALRAGFEAATSEVVVMMDADGQDDPTEIPRLLDALEAGADLAGGRRVRRNDRFIKRTTSKLYNAATAMVAGVDGHDFNSGLKAMRREVTEEAVLYGELHRYLPVLAAWQGFTVVEVDVEHHERLHGASKYGVARFWRGMLDLITVRFLGSYERRPLHLFGGLGIVFGVIGSLLLGWMFVLHLGGERVGTRPAVIVGVLFAVVAVQLITTGLVAELIVRQRHGPATRAVAIPIEPAVEE
jgi:glycosyltransferase involved in cell wall biosynthesis